MVCNLHQNPGKRPVIASWLPALLRQGVMFLVNLNPTSRCPEERWMLDQDSRKKQCYVNDQNHAHYLLDVDCEI